MTDKPKLQQLRDDIAAAIDSGCAGSTASLIRSLWNDTGDVATASWIRKIGRRNSRLLRLKPARIVILRSTTIEPLIPVFDAEAITHGLLLDLHIGRFGTWVEDMLKPDGDAYRPGTDVVIVDVHPIDLAPDIWCEFSRLTAEDVNKSIERVTELFLTVVTEFRKRSTAALIVHNLPLPFQMTRGVLDGQTSDSQASVIKKINLQISEIVRACPGSYILDVDSLSSRHGKEHWVDEVKWQSSRLAVAPGHFRNMASEWIRYLCPIMGVISKVLVVDLDNTLWGGVLGEDGIGQLLLGPTFPGTAFLNLHRVILDLAHRGVVLAICSKNEHSAAIRALDSLENGLLRASDFAVFRINWNDKAQNLKEIASELNLGIDSLAFLDDNPVERHRVSTELPEVKVIHLSTDPTTYAMTLRDCPYFERLTLSADDSRRAADYAHQRLRNQLKESSGSLEAFYRSLQLSVRFESITDQNCGRLAQLTQRTNQFNLTTRRYNEPQIREFAQRENVDVIAVNVRDRFSNNGLVGLAIVFHNKGVSVIDTFLLSCRVIGRTIETALLAETCRISKMRGSDEIEGIFIPTEKNEPAKDLFEKHGFTETSNGTLSIWKKNLLNEIILIPDWINNDTTMEQ